MKPKTEVDASECCLWLLASNRIHCHSMQTSRVVWVQGRRLPSTTLSQISLLPSRHFRRLSCCWRLTTKTSIQRRSLTCSVVVAARKALWFELAVESTLFAPFRHVQSPTARLNTRLCQRLLHCPRAESKKVNDRNVKKYLRIKRQQDQTKIWNNELRAAVHLSVDAVHRGTVDAFGSMHHYRRTLRHSSVDTFIFFYQFKHLIIECYSLNFLRHYSIENLIIYSNLLIELKQSNDISKWTENFFILKLLEFDFAFVTSCISYFKFMYYKRKNRRQNAPMAGFARF